MKMKQDVMCIVLFIVVASNQLLPEVTKKEILLTILIVELAEHSPIIIHPIKPKKFGCMTCALEICGKNKMQALLLGLAKSIYYIFKQLGDGRKKKYQPRGYHLI